MTSKDDFDTWLSVSHYDTFAELYNAVYPGNSDSFIKVMFDKLMSAIEDFEIIVDEYYYSVKDGLGDSFLGLRAVYALFDESDFVSYYRRLRSFIIETNDASLSETDYALLFYISLQGVEVQQAARGLPLSMLYDMFLPVAQENLLGWELSP
jgi:hypothetical protein